MICYITLSLTKGVPKGITGVRLHGPAALFTTRRTAALHVAVGKGVAPKTYLEACTYHGTCLDCVLTHRGHQNHLPA